MILVALLIVGALALHLVLGGGVVWGFRKLQMFPYTEGHMECIRSSWGRDRMKVVTAPMGLVIGLWVLWPIAILVLSLFGFFLFGVGIVLGLATATGKIFRLVAGPGIDGWWK